MVDAPTWRSACREAERLRPSDKAVLELIGRLPLAPVSALVPFWAGRSRRSVHAYVARLSRRGLVCAIPGPADLAGPHERLLLLTDLGLAALASRRGVEPVSLARAWGLARTRLQHLVGELPAVLNLYVLLGLVAATRPGRVRLVHWARPWRCRPEPAEVGPGRSVRLPRVCGGVLGERERRATGGELCAGCRHRWGLSTSARASDPWAEAFAGGDCRGCAVADDRDDFGAPG